jgi:uncharacterized membrane protein
VPIVAVLLAIIFGVLSLVLFIAFINTISNAVRIDTILDGLFQSTQKSMKETATFNQQYGKPEKLPDEVDEWHAVESLRSGYFIGLDISDALSSCEAEEVDLSVSVFTGEFLLQGDELFSVSKKLEDEKIEALLACFRIDISENVQADYLHGLQQMTEIAIKAMSPGINDPATALSAIDYLSALLQQYLEQEIQLCMVGEEKKSRIWIKSRPFEQVLFKIFAPLRTYCTGDVIVSRKMIYTLQRLQKTEGLPSEIMQLLDTEIKKVKSDAQERILNVADRKIIEQL